MGTKMRGGVKDDLKSVVVSWKDVVEWDEVLAIKWRGGKSLIINAPASPPEAGRAKYGRPLQL